MAITSGITTSKGVVGEEEHVRFNPLCDRALAGFLIVDRG
jgi:hypothetical protein